MTGFLLILLEDISVQTRDSENEFLMLLKITIEKCKGENRVTHQEI